MDEVTYNNLRKTFDRKLIKLNIEAPNLSALDYLNTFVIQMPIFRNLTLYQQKEEIRKEDPREFQAGITLLKEGEGIDSVYFVEKGCLTEKVEGEETLTFNRGVGSIVGLANILNPESKSYTEISTTQNSKLIKISSDSISYLMNHNDKFTRDVYADSIYLITLIKAE